MDAYISINYRQKMMSEREDSGRAGGAAALPRSPQGNSPSRRVHACGRFGRGKRGYRRTGNPFIKALQACPDSLSPLMAGVSPRRGWLLSGFVSHESRHLPVRVPVTDFAQRFPCQVSEYQQCETHNQYTPDQGISRQFHSRLLLCKFTQILQLPQNTKGGIARC
jgi:hypothetical protein